MSKLSQNMSNIKNIYYSIPFTYSSSSFCLSYRIAIVSIHPFIHSFIEFQFSISLLITITIPLSHSECNFPLMTNIFVIIYIIFWFKISSQLIVTPLKPLSAHTDDIRDLFGYHNWEATHADLNLMGDLWATAAQQQCGGGKLKERLMWMWIVVWNRIWQMYGLE